MRKLKPMLHAQKSMQATKCISVQKLYLHTWTIALGLMYLGTQLGDERSISHVANKFIGTGMMGPKPAAPEPPAPAMADPPGAAATAGTGAGAPIPGFMKAARTPPLSTAVAITDPKRRSSWTAMVEDLTAHAQGPDGFLLQLISHIHRFAMVRGGASLQKRMWSKCDLWSAYRRRWITGSIYSSVGHSLKRRSFEWFSQTDSRTVRT